MNCEDCGHFDDSHLGDGCYHRNLDGKYCECGFSLHYLNRKHYPPRKSDNLGIRYTEDKEHAIQTLRRVIESK